MANPELRRNLWLEFTSIKLIVWPVVIGLILLAALGLGTFACFVGGLLATLLFGNRLACLFRLGTFLNLRIRLFGSRFGFDLRLFKLRRLRRSGAVVNQNGFDHGRSLDLLRHERQAEKHQQQQRNMQCAGDQQVSRGDHDESVMAGLSCAASDRARR